MFDYALCRAFFGHSEKTQARKNSKLKRILMKTQVKISEKLKNRQLNLSFYNIKVAFSYQKCAAG